MEVLVGPTFTIDVPSSPLPSGHTDAHLFFNEVSREELPATFRISRPAKFFAGGSPEPESSSSIGTPDDESDNGEEIQSEFKGRNGLGSLDSLEDSLPIKFVPFSLLINIFLIRELKIVFNFDLILV